MKSYKEYLMESQKVYTFKVKIAGNCPKDCKQLIEQGLAQFDVSSVSSGKTTPITVNQHEFPEHKNIEVTIFDVTTKYPATSKQVHDKLAHVIGKPLNEIRVRNEWEEREIEINHEHDEASGKAIVGTPYAPSDNQDRVGVKHAMSFLKELEKNKLQLQKIEGVNDQLFPTPVREAEQAEQSRVADKSGSTSPIGTNKTKLNAWSASRHNSLEVPAKAKAKGK